MNKERLARWKKAGEYQKKAIYALMPEWMDKHLDVIEREMALMIQDAAKELVFGNKKSEKENEVRQEDAPKVKKVDIR